MKNSRPPSLKWKLLFLNKVNLDLYNIRHITAFKEKWKNFKFVLNMILMHVTFIMTGQ